MDKKEEIILYMDKLGVKKSFYDEIIKFRDENRVDESLEKRIPVPKSIFYGSDIVNKAVAAILSGHNILLTGPKASGKNLLAENLAFIFNRPMWNVSLNVNTDTSSLIGEDTYRNGEVVFRKGPVSQAAENGGFAVFDEINMAKNEALAVVYSALDFRRKIDIPGYELIELDSASRFIATMNYGYSGTRELSEALVSRFMVIDVPVISEDDMKTVILSSYPVKDEIAARLTDFFKDLELKALNSEISSKSVDLRGLLASLDTMKKGLSLYDSIDMGIIDKCFEEYEKDVVRDILKISFPENLESEEIFSDL